MTVKKEGAVEKRSGTCQVCGRAYQLTQNGYLRKHWKRDGQGKGLPFSDPCAGSGNLPAGAVSVSRNSEAGLPETASE